jgi:acyl-CoA reductase-like NAD-dependent aldehyde dehydrogenase
LKQLFWLIDENEDAFLDSLAKDLHRHAFKSLMADINEAKKAILESLKYLEVWAAGSSPPEAGFIYGTLGKAWIRKEPLGLVLVIGAWNFPISMLVDVAIAAIAAGNAVIMKPSEMAQHTERLLDELVPKYLDTSGIAVVRANPTEMAPILEHKFDFIFYTGSARVGRMIASDAAKHVTPTALELGGQAPAIVTKSANIDIAAKRLVNAKLQNLGQICVCVNHVFADPEIHDQLTARMVYWAKRMLENGSDTLARIVNENHFDRIRGLIQKTEGNGIYSGEHIRADRFVHPIIVTDVTLSDSLLSEELFGPVLPIIKADVDSAIKTISSMPHPLCYGPNTGNRLINGYQVGTAGVRVVGACYR